MNELTASIIIEQGQKRIPQSRAGRLYQILRDRLVDEMKADFWKRPYMPVNDKLNVQRLNTIKWLNDRINRIFQKEDSTKQLQLFMEDAFTNERTKIAFIERGKTITGTFTGSITEAKNHIRNTRGVVRFVFGHSFRADEKLIRGIWTEMGVN